MIIYLLFQQVLSFDLPQDTYILRQNKDNLQYYIVIDNKEFIIDLNNDFSVTDIDGESQECNINYKCQYCDQVCQFTFIDSQDQEQNGTLQESVIQIENINGIGQIEEFIALKSDNTNFIGLGIRRQQQYQNFTFPQNTFISNVVSMCFSSFGFIHKSLQKNLDQAITIPYQQSGNFYSLRFKQIKLGYNITVNIEKLDVQFDTINPFTELPKDIFSEFANYYKQLGFSMVGQGYLSIHENKFKLSDLTPIKIYINETYYLEYQTHQLLYQYGEYIQLPFKQSKKRSLIFGVAFLNNLYLTINQNDKSFSFSQFDCSSKLLQNSYSLFQISIVLGALLLFVILIQFFKKAKSYIKVTQVQELELQNSTIEREKEEEQQL